MKILISVILLLVVASSIAYININDEPYVKENISSYDIMNRYDCERIQDTQEYNKCVKFYLSATPYKLGDVLVPIKLVE